VRRYAEDTAVPVAKSRGEIDTLLRAWGALGIQWSDDFEHDRVMLRFVWPRGAQRYMARFAVALAPLADLKAQAIDRRTRRMSQGKLDKLLAARGRQEHRLLALWLKAALNAVEAGLVDAETLFLPFLEGTDGRTFAEAAVPRLADLTMGSAARLLPAPSSGESEGGR
jgi:hypothetical protein